MNFLFKNRIFISIAALVLVYVFSRGFLIGTKSTLNFDEGITMVGASGNLPSVSEQLANDSGYFSILRSQETLGNYLFLPKNGLDFKSVYIGQRNYDIHPPLYFYLLHVFIYLFGNNLSVLILLNVFIELISIFLIWKIFRLLKVSVFHATLALVFFIIMSPTVIAFGMLRQYYLLFLAILLCTIGSLIWIKSGNMGTKSYFLFIIGISTGILTHFSFVLFILAALLSFLIFYWRLFNVKSLISVVFIAGISLFLVEILNPGFTATILQKGGERKSSESVYDTSYILENNAFLIPVFAKNYIGKMGSLILDIMALISSFVFFVLAYKKNRVLAMVYFPIFLFFIFTVVFCLLGYFPWRVISGERYKLSFAFLSLVPLIVLLASKKPIALFFIIILVLNQLVLSFYHVNLEKSHSNLPIGNFRYYKPDRGFFSLIANMNKNSKALVWNKEIKHELFELESAKSSNEYIIIFKKKCNLSEISSFDTLKKIEWIHRDCACYKLQ